METGESQTFVDFPFITLCLISCETQLQEQTTKRGCASGKLPKVWVPRACCFNVKHSK